MQQNKHAMLCKSKALYLDCDYHSSWFFWFQYVVFSCHNVYFSGFTPCSGGHGQPVSYKQLGAGTARESMRSLYVKQKTGSKMLWQEKLEAHRAYLPLYMHQSLQPMHYETCDKRVSATLDLHQHCCHCCLRSLLSLILPQSVMTSSTLLWSD